MKVTETRLDTLIDNLNTLICEDDLLTRQERETLVRAVAAIGAMKARVSMKKPTVPAASKPKEEKQAPIPDPRFPNARQAWVAEEKLYYWMRSMASRMMILVSIFSGFPRNWGERRSASPVKSRRKDI
jgi:hypothetical protein